MKQWPVALLLTAAAGALLWRGAVSGQAPEAFDASARTVLVRLGVSDRTGQTWKGRINAASGGGRVIRGGAIDTATRPWAAQFQQVDLSPARATPRPIFPEVIQATVSGERFRLELNGKAHEFSLTGLPLAFEDGNVEVEEAATPFELSAAGEADFPALAAGPSGRLAAVWQEYDGTRDRIAWREFDGAAWSAPEALSTAETADVLRPVAAYDGAGVLHVIWSAQVDGNFDLYERQKTAQGWQPARRLTDAAGSDFHPRAIADSEGGLWLAWQARSDIFARRYRGGTWEPEFKVSVSPASDWEPAIAAAPDGAVWFGWDSYDRGNYDIFVRSWKAGVLGPVRAVTKSPRFQAHVSLAADGDGRLWMAFDEAEANWGKDYGYLFKDRGNPLYQSRRIQVLRLDGDRLTEPESSLSAAFPLALPEYVQYPQLAITRDGKPAILALQLSRADQVIEVWGSRGVWENVAFTLDGGGWRRHQPIPQSAGAHDMRASLTRDSSGALWAAWAADGRSYTAPQPRRQVVRAARLVERPPAADAIAVRDFVERPELSFPSHANEAASVAAVRRYAIRSGARQYRIMRGDLHRHTSLSQDGVGDGSLWDLYRYALDAASMDYAAVTDHQGGGNAYNWWKTQKSTDLFLAPGRLTPLYAYERSVLFPNGHRNIVFTKRGAPILPLAPGEQQGKVRSADAVLPYLRQYNAIAFRHTIATNQGTDWKEHDNELEPLVEIFQGHRVVYEHEGGPKGATAEKIYMQRSGYQPSGFMWNALAKGYRMGIQASSDHCSTHISYACILTEGESRDALVDAMRKRHTYGATDNIVMDFRVYADGKQYLQGDEVPAARRYTLSVNAIGTGPIRRIDVIHNESYAYSMTPAGKSAAQFTYTDPKAVQGENRYYVRLEQEDGNLAWSSPVWVSYDKRQP